MSSEQAEEGWIEAEFKRATERRSRLPEYAKPVVCSGHTVSRYEHLRATFPSSVSWFGG